MRFLAFFLLALVAFASLSAAVDISACTNLAASTSYRLTASITNAAGTCMNVSGDNTVLDLNGFTIDGNLAAGKAAVNMTATGVDGFIMENGSITEWNMAMNSTTGGGHTTWRVKNVLFQNITGTYSLQITGVNTSNFTNNTFRNTTTFAFQGVSGALTNFSIINDSTWINCAGDCILIDGNCDNNVIANSTIINGTAEGIEVSGALQTGTNVTNVTMFNVSRGFFSVDSGGANLNRLRVFNTTKGIQLGPASTNFFANNTEIYNATTNYIDVASGTFNLNNLTLGQTNSTGKAFWSGSIAVTADITEGSNIYVQPSFITVNDGTLTFLNTTTTVTLAMDSPCLTSTTFQLYNLSGMPTSRAAIMGGGSFNQNVTCSNNATTFNVTHFTAQRGYAPFVIWFGKHNETPSSGSANVSTILYVTFYNESGGSAISIDSAAISLSLTNGTYPGVGAFEISYSAAGAVSNATVRAYPDQLVANISSTESYAKADYTTRSRFMVYANTSLNVQQNISIYFLSDSLASYSIINVVNNGNPVPGAYVSILKFFSSTSAYTLIDQKITNSGGQSAGYFDPVAYYKFLVYDSNGNLIYTSSAAEQFICDTTCAITLNIGTGITLQSRGPYPVGLCYGNATTNFINFIYSDATGLTQNITFLAWRAKNYTSTTPVCNNTVSASSGSYNCNLTAVTGENLSVYPYYCEVRIVASPERPIFGEIIDLVLQSLNTDWLFPGIAVALICGAAGLVSPVIGLAAVGVGMTGLYLIGILPLAYTFVVYILVAAGMLIFLKAD